MITVSHLMTSFNTKVQTSCLNLLADIPEKMWNSLGFFSKLNIKNGNGVSTLQDLVEVSQPQSKEILYVN